MLQNWQNLNPETLDGEIWKSIDIEWLYGSYEISNFGRVRIFGKSYKAGKNTWHTQETYIKKQIIGTYGYPQIIVRFNNKQMTKKVHRLVAAAFIHNPKNYPQINHINCIKTDNMVENLEWCNNSINQLHSYKFGNKIPQIGDTNGNSKLKNQQVIEILNSTLPSKELSVKYNVSKTHINRIKKGNSGLIAKNSKPLVQKELFEK